MRKIIAAINMTLDGYCDHTAGIANDETHEHYNELMHSCDMGLMGRTTYQLMESAWPEMVKNPIGNKPVDDFAVLMDNIQKIVYSRTLTNVTWKNSTLKSELVKENILELKEQPGKNILVGSRSIIVQLVQMGMIDELQLAIHPVILGKGLPLFKDISEQIDLKLLKTKSFECGVVVHYYGRPM